MTSLSWAESSFQLISQRDSTKIEPPLYVTEQRQFLSSVTTVLIWEWPIQGVMFRRSSKGSVRDGQRTTFLQKAQHTTEDLSMFRTVKFPYTIPKVHLVAQNCKGLRSGLLFPESGDETAIKPTSVLMNQVLVLWCFKTNYSIFLQMLLNKNSKPLISNSASSL